MEVTDQMGFKINIPDYPAKIISLVPSITELLFDLNLEDELAGITRYCILPEDKVAGKTKIGGTKDFNFEEIEEINPDLIIGSKEENYREGIERLRERYKVWMSNVKCIQDALDLINFIGMLTNRVSEAEGLINEIRNNLLKLEFTTEIRTAYRIWKNPFMAAGGDTFIDDMLKTGGFKNIFALRTVYPQINPGEMKDAELLLLSSEPYNVSEEDHRELKKILPGKKIFQIDGKIFSWYGSRMKYASGYIREFRKKIIPDVI